jgi:hypothetical protein
MSLSSSTKSAQSRALAAVAVVLAAAATGLGVAAAATPDAGHPTAAGGGCPEYACGSGGNHNEVLATSALG